MNKRAVVKLAERWSWAALLSGVALGACGDDDRMRITQLDDAMVGDIASADGDVCGDDAELCEPSPCSLIGAPEDCCVEDADCDDGDPRTLDVCEGASCVHHKNPDACLTDADCNDDEPCTTDRCEADAVCSHIGDASTGCCEAAEKVIADFDKESLQGLYVTDNFETGLFWRTDRTRATSGEFGLYCGDPVSQTYSNDSRVKSSATTRILEIPKGGDTVLEFDLYKATRVGKYLDVFQVLALRDGALFPLWSSKSFGDGTTAGAWERIKVPLSEFAGQSLQVRFVFDSFDAPDAPFEGTYLDTIELVTGCN